MTPTECPPQSVDQFHQLLEAAKKGDDNQCLFFLERTPELAHTYSPDTGMMLCHAAASGHSKGNVSILRKLKEYYPLIYECEDPDGLSPLHHSIMGGCNKMVGFLLQDGHPEAPESHYKNRTPLHGASARLDEHSYELVQIFLDHNSDTATYKDANGNTPIHIAAQEGNEPAARAFKHARCGLSIENDAGETPYAIALEKNLPFAAILKPFTTAMRVDHDITSAANILISLKR